ncbi:MAG TPA: hypothetical protein VMU84_07715 [Thermoanaerobaculia bacterium]|nr:hypothetical protein [Thermoanaerobaculia bacterium]
MFVALPLRAQDDIHFDPAITQDEFSKFSRIVAQGIYATPVEPARARGLLGFDIGVAATLVDVDPNASYWQRAVQDDFTVSDYVAVPRLVASKGFGYGTISASYAKVQDTDAQILGGAIDIPIISGGVLKPTLAVRGVYSQLSGVDVYDLKTYGVELYLSKGFGPITPYGAIGRMRSDAEGVIPAAGARPEVRLSDNSDLNRVTVGVRLSLLLPKISIEATQAEQRSYAAKISFGF